jgi:thiol:disulfide interchange protein
MKTVFILLMALCLVAPAMAQSPAVAAAAGPKIEWLTWEEAAKRMEKQPRKIMVDVYTDWCGWCKRMDAATMTDPGVIKVLNAVLRGQDGRRIQAGHPVQRPHL